MRAVLSVREATCIHNGAADGRTVRPCSMSSSQDTMRSRPPYLPRRRGEGGERGRHSSVLTRWLDRLHPAPAHLVDCLLGWTGRSPERGPPCHAAQAPPAPRPRRCKQQLLQPATDRPFRAAVAVAGGADAEDRPNRPVRACSAAAVAAVVSGVQGAVSRASWAAAAVLPPGLAALP